LPTAVVVFFCIRKMDLVKEQTKQVIVNAFNSLIQEIDTCSNDYQLLKMMKKIEHMPHVNRNKTYKIIQALNTIKESRLKRKREESQELIRQVEERASKKPCFFMPLNTIQANHRAIINIDISRLVLSFACTSTLLSLRGVSRQMFTLVYEKPWPLQAILNRHEYNEYADLFPWIRYATLYQLYSNHITAKEKECLREWIKEYTIARINAEIHVKKQERFKAYKLAHTNYMVNALPILSPGILDYIVLNMAHATFKQNKYDPFSKTVERIKLLDCKSTNMVALRNLVHIVCYRGTVEFTTGQKSVQLPNFSKAYTYCIEMCRFRPYAFTEVHIANFATIILDEHVRTCTIVNHIVVDYMYQIPPQERRRFQECLVQEYNNVLCKIEKPNSIHREQVALKICALFPWIPKDRFTCDIDINEAVFITSPPNKHNSYYLALTSSSLHCHYTDYIDPKHRFAVFDITSKQFIMLQEWMSFVDYPQ
jgi:hypothetical protein